MWGLLKRALNHLSHLHAFPTLWQMVQDVSFLKVCCRLPGTTCDSASFLQTGFLPTYTPGRRWNNFNSLNLPDMESSGNFPECITAEIIKKSQVYHQGFALFCYRNNPKPQNQLPTGADTKSTSLNLPVLFICLSHAALVKMIFWTSNSRNHNHEDETWLS